ncbi:hypothetical protein I4F81_006773 [Pyropia yezoensis]|uniref:Uncharacterized protein n=1 Tax=Pyropia yezoensis TaxID=2788 RepID=A0ACC3C2Y0_PYRYE|nr:hypothetical protein I4F81_006773 [Neopyropia yezoensis]
MTADSEIVDGRLLFAAFGCVINAARVRPPRRASTRKTTRPVCGDKTDVCSDASTSDRGANQPKEWGQMRGIQYESRRPTAPAGCCQLATAATAGAGGGIAAGAVAVVAAAAVMVAPARGYPPLAVAVVLVAAAAAAGTRKRVARAPCCCPPPASACPRPTNTVGERTWRKRLSPGSGTSPTTASAVGTARDTALMTDASRRPSRVTTYAVSPA